MQRIDAHTLRSWITDGQELALLDAREEGEFGASHLFWAVPCPLSKREIRARALLPRLSTRICCVDDGRGLAEHLAGWLEKIGATNVAVLDGGTKAWAAAGYVLFSGVNVPSKAFGEWVEHHYGTQSVDAPELKAWLDSGRDMVVLDSRTQEEFTRMSIPSGMSVPGGELVYRIGDLAPDPKTLVVVNCAGRTRSIMGAESLRRAGIPNQVVALRNGTMGWELAGLRCDRGRAERFTPGTPKTLALALQRAKALRRSVRRRRDRPAGPGARWRTTPTARCTCWTCATRAEFRDGPPSRQPQRAGRATGAGHRHLDRRAQRPHRADRRYRRARAHGRGLAAPDGASRRVRRRGRAGRAGRHRRCEPVPELRLPVPHDRRRRPGCAAGQRRRHRGDRPGAQHRLPRRPYPRRAVGRAHPAGCAGAAAGGGEACGDHLARRRAGAAGGGRGEGADHGRGARAGGRHRRPGTRSAGRW